jgi:hypothetical protein
LMDAWMNNNDWQNIIHMIYIICINLNKGD